MEEKIEVLFGNSYIYPETIIVQEVSIVGYYKDPYGNDMGPEYNSDAESWMARTDMRCSIFSVEKSSLDVLDKKYTEFVQAAWDKSIDDETVNRLRQEFLSMVE